MKQLAEVMEYDIDVENWDSTILMLCATSQILRLKEENNNMKILLGDKWRPLPKGMTLLPDEDFDKERFGKAFKEFIDKNKKT